MEINLGACARYASSRLSDASIRSKVHFDTPENADFEHNGLKINLSINRDRNLAVLCLIDSHNVRPNKLPTYHRIEGLVGLNNHHIISELNLGVKIKDYRLYVRSGTIVGYDEIKRKGLENISIPNEIIVRYPLDEPVGRPGKSEHYLHPFWAVGFRPILRAFQ